jgi:quercetin dioxygenase-like cupin family protein
LNVADYIASGILEEFVLGQLSEEECSDILKLSKQYPEIKGEITTIEKSLEVYANAHAVTPPLSLEASIFSAIEEAEIPPVLSAKSTISEYEYWLDTVKEPEDYKEMHMEVLSQTPEATMVIAWIKNGEPDHLHTKYTEKFLIVEGDCIATIDGVTANYGVGDYVEFVIDKRHEYIVTSDIPMKVIACLAHKAA